jgi:AAA+ ATPase superfamily predicted ATPase
VEQGTEQDNMKFYDREKEIQVLLEAYDFKKAEMAVITGRRRVGKTRLIDEFLKKKNGIKVMVVPKEEKQVSQDFVEVIKEKIGYSPPLTNMRDVLEYFFNSEELKLMCIDEFSNFQEVDKAIPYEVQKLWDKYKHKTNKLLILSGSYVSMMNKIFTKKKAPLFNRAGISITLEQLNLLTVWKMLNDIDMKNPKEKIAAYCVFGGVPFYYELIEKRIQRRKGIYDIINAVFIEVGGPLKEEGYNILRQEFGDSYKKYFGVLEAISSGLVSITEISNKLGIKPTTLAKYLVALQQDYKIVERLVPYPQSLTRSKKGLYRIKDNTIAFWFSLVYGSQQTPTKKDIDDFISRRFEDFCLDVFVRFLEKENEQVKYKGKWWGSVKLGDHGEQREIDIVVETDDYLYLGEAKWTNSKKGEQDINWLKESSDTLVRLTKKKVKYVFFSKEGFTMKEKEGVLLFDCERIDGVLRR